MRVCVPVGRRLEVDQLVNEEGVVAALEEPTERPIDLRSGPITGDDDPAMEVPTTSDMLMLPLEIPAVLRADRPLLLQAPADQVPVGVFDEPSVLESDPVESFRGQPQDHVRGDVLVGEDTRRHGPRLSSAGPADPVDSLFVVRATRLEGLVRLLP